MRDHINLAEAVLPGPALTSIFNGKLYDTHCMICTGCWQVELHSFRLSEDDDGQKMLAKLKVIHQGNGFCKSGANRHDSRT